MQKICDRVGIIRDGRLVGERSISEMELEASQTFYVVFGKSIMPIKELKKVPGVKVKQIGDNTLSIHLHGDLSKLLGVLAKYPLQHLSVRELNLEQEFLRYYYRGGKRWKRWLNGVYGNGGGWFYGGVWAFLSLFLLT